MWIQVSDKSSGEDLKAYLEAGECVVRKVAEVSFMGEVTFDVSIPRAPSDDQARREIAIYEGLAGDAPGEIRPHRGMKRKHARLASDRGTLKRRSSLMPSTSAGREGRD